MKSSVQGVDVAGNYLEHGTKLEQRLRRKKNHDPDLDDPVLPALTDGREIYILQPLYAASAMLATVMLSIRRPSAKTSKTHAHC